MEKSPHDQPNYILWTENDGRGGKFKFRRSDGASTTDIDYAQSFDTEDDAKKVGGTEWKTRRYRDFEQLI
jgi:hypothetical protein